MMTLWLYCFKMTPMVYPLKIVRIRPALIRCVSGVLLCLCLIGMNNSQAVTLSRPQIKSNLGAPLKVEIDLSYISEEELVDLQASLADEAGYKASGIALNTGLEDAELQLLTREDNSKYLKITGVRPVTDPYIELMVNLKWATGSILRSLGLVLPSDSTNPEPKPVQAPVVSSTQVVAVKAGDTAGAIALQNMDKNQLSLDQMLVALLKTNPDAFIQKNVNLVKAGAQLKIPSTETALAFEKDQAHSEVVLQAKAFANYRSSLASKLPDSELPKDEKSVTGKVSAKVKETTPAPKDQLKLSSPQIQADTAQLPKEERIAQQKQAEVTTERRQELLQNIEDLSKLAQTTGLDVKSGFLSGIPNLVKINNIDDLKAWVSANFQLVYVLSFIFGCVLLLWIWIRINKVPSKTSAHDSSSEIGGLNRSLDHTVDEISSSPVFQPMPETTAESFPTTTESHIQMMEPGFTHQDHNAQREAQTQPHPIKFDFDLDIAPIHPSTTNAPSATNTSSATNESYSREPLSPVLTQTNTSTAEPTHPSASHKHVEPHTPDSASSSPIKVKPSAAQAHHQAPHTTEEEDPFRVRLDLAEELWKLGQKHTGRALAQEVADQANEQMKEVARRWLAEHP